MRTFYRLPRTRTNSRWRCRLLANEPFWFVLVSAGNPDRTRKMAEFLLICNAVALKQGFHGG